MPLTVIDQGLLSSTAQYTGFKSRIINGGMTIDQRNAGASVSTPTKDFDVDRWKLQFSGGGVATVQQSSTVPSSTTFTNSVVLTVTTPDSSLASGDYYGIAQYIEGYNVADLGFGTAAASPVTLSFWVQSSVTGTYSVAFSNQDGATRTYVATYTINSANTWEQKTITVAGDTTGTWNKTNSNGLRIWFSLGMGSTYETSSPNTWVASQAIQSTSSVDWIATNGATFYITGVQLEKGSTATSFDYRPYGTELALCQRYCMAWRQASAQTYMAIGQCYSATAALIMLPFPVTPRVIPTSITVSSPADYGALSAIGGGSGGTTMTINTASTAAVGISYTATTSVFTAGNATSLYTQTAATNAYIYTNGSEL